MSSKKSGNFEAALILLLMKINLRLLFISNTRLKNVPDDNSYNRITYRMIENHIRKRHVAHVSRFKNTEIAMF